MDGTSPVSSSFLSASTDHYSSGRLSRTFCRSLPFPCAAPICPLLCPVSSSDLGLSGLSALSAQPRTHKTLLSPVIPSPCHGLHALPTWSPGALHNSSSLSSFSQDHCLLLPISSFCCCFRWEGRFCAYYSILA